MLQVLRLSDEVYVSTQILMDTLGITRQTFCAWKRQGRFPEPIKLGKVNFYCLDEFETKITDRTAITAKKNRQKD
jgi:predicted DNA-binding transcriptional regulator AlpA